MHSKVNGDTDLEETIKHSDWDMLCISQSCEMWTRQLDIEVSIYLRVVVKGFIRMG